MPPIPVNPEEPSRQPALFRFCKFSGSFPATPAVSSQPSWLHAQPEVSLTFMDCSQPPYLLTIAGIQPDRDQPEKYEVAGQQLPGTIPAELVAPSQDITIQRFSASPDTVDPCLFILPPSPERGLKLSVIARDQISAARFQDSVRPIGPASDHELTYTREISQLDTFPTQNQSPTILTIAEFSPKDSVIPPIAADVIPISLPSNQLSGTKQPQSDHSRRPRLIQVVSRANCCRSGLRQSPQRRRCTPVHTGRVVPAQRALSN